MINNIVCALIDNIIIVLIIVCFTVFNITEKILDYKLEKARVEAKSELTAALQGHLEKLLDTEIFKGE
ncbi:MAG: hypothetical protein V1793_25170 [Pseudomonadota bacterium]